MNCVYCKKEDFKIIDQNDMMVTIICNKCGMISDIAKINMKPIKELNMSGIKFVED